MKSLLTLGFFFILVCSSHAQTNPLIPHHPFHRVADSNIDSNIFEGKPAPDLFSSGQYILDSLHYLEWDEELKDQWAFRSREFFTWDTEGQVISQLVLESYSDGWEPFILDLYVYDDAGNQVEDLLQRWSGVSWVNQSRWSYEFDANNKQTLQLIEDWTGSSWVNSQRVVYTYTSSNNISTRENAIWLNDMWVTRMRHTWTYDEDDKILLQLIESYTGTWTNNTQVIYSYNDQHQLIETLNQHWETDHWENNLRENYTYYGNDNLHTYVTQNYVEEEWVNLDLFTYEYDLSSNITILLYQVFNNESLVNSQQYIETYDENQNRITEIFVEWYDEWITQDSFHYFYSGISATNNYTQISGLSVFPNPVKDVLHIDIPEQYEVTGPVTILSVSDGRHILTQTLRDREIKTQSLIPGNYILLIPLNGQQIPVQFIKQ
ncbi:MAG: T9SS type A sorting domain-containing protein [Bacteroidota bacterium]|nr:T9SS type A sorting domain-containing protein [Bacteroidota bacterium]